MGRPDRRDAVGGTGRDGPASPGRLPAEGSSMGMGRRRFGCVSEHVIEKAQEAVEALCMLAEHMFVQRKNGVGRIRPCARILAAPWGTGRRSLAPGTDRPEP